MIESIYFTVERLILFTNNAVAAVIQGVALGVLSNARLEALTQHRYSNDAAQLGSYASDEYLDSGLFLWEQNCINQFPKEGRVLVAAAGAGREMIALSAQGFQVEGFDCCPSLVEIGRTSLAKRGITAQLHHAAPSRVPDNVTQYDAAVVGFSGYMYIAGRERRVEFLRSLAKLLSPNALVMISFKEGTRGRRRKWTASIGSFLRRLRGALPVEEGDTLSNGFQHHFLPEQVAQEMDEAGLDLTFYSGGTLYGHAIGVVRVNPQNLLPR